jgi:hypothetical protein
MVPSEAPARSPARKTNREKALVLVAFIILLGATGVAVLGVGFANWGASECEPGHCDTTRQIALGVASCIGLIPACAGAWAADQGDKDLFVKFAVATGAAWITPFLVLGL